MVLMRLKSTAVTRFQLRRYATIKWPQKTNTYTYIHIHIYIYIYIYICREREREREYRQLTNERKANIKCLSKVLGHHVPPTFTLQI